MKYKTRNRNVFISILCVALLLTLCAFITSCKDENAGSLYPEYTGDNPWTYPPDDIETGEIHHIYDGSDNVIDFGAFTEEDTQAHESVTEDAWGDVEIGENTASEPSSDGGEDDEPEDTTCAHGSEHDGIHDFPGDEFDIDAYQTMRPLPDWTRPVPSN